MVSGLLLYGAEKLGGTLFLLTGGLFALVWSDAFKKYLKENQKLIRPINRQGISFILWLSYDNVNLKVVEIWKM